MTPVSPAIARGSRDPKAAAIGRQPVTVDRKRLNATVYDRAKLKANNKLRGPAIVMEMDSTTVILPKHTGTVDKYGNILIYPDNYKPLKKAAAPKAKAKSAKKPAKKSGKKSGKKAK